MSRNEIVLGTIHFSEIEGDVGYLVQLLVRYHDEAVQLGRSEAKLRLREERNGFNPSGEVTVSQFFEIYC